MNKVKKYFVFFYLPLNIVSCDSSSFHIFFAAFLSIVPGIGQSAQIQIYLLHTHRINNRFLNGKNRDFTRTVCLNRMCLLNYGKSDRVQHKTDSLIYLFKKVF